MYVCMHVHIIKMTYACIRNDVYMETVHKVTRHALRVYVYVCDTQLGRTFLLTKTPLRKKSSTTSCACNVCERDMHMHALRVRMRT